MAGAEVIGIIGLIASCMTIQDEATTLLHGLVHIRQKLQDTGSNLHLLSTRIRAIKSASSRISSWLGKYPGNSLEDSEIDAEFNAVLDACLLLLGVMEHHLPKDAQSSSGISRALPFSQELRFMWNEKTIRELEEKLDRQVQAMDLLLHCIQLSVHSSTLNRFLSLTLPKAGKPQSSKSACR